MFTCHSVNFCNYLDEDFGAELEIDLFGDLDLEEEPVLVSFIISINETTMKAKGNIQINNGIVVLK